MRFEYILNPEKYGYKICNHCNGYGSSLKDPPSINVCSKCRGSGIVLNTNQNK